MSAERIGVAKAWPDFVQVPTRHVLRAHELPGKAFIVYLYLVMRAGEDYKCFPTQTTIAGELGIPERTVNRAIADLARAQWIHKTDTPRREGLRWAHKLYLVTGPPVTDDETAEGLRDYYANWNPPQA